MKILSIFVAFLDNTNFKDANEICGRFLDAIDKIFVFFRHNFSLKGLSKNPINHKQMVRAHLPTFCQYILIYNSISNSFRAARRCKRIEKDT